MMLDPLPPPTSLHFHSSQAVMLVKSMSLSPKENQVTTAIVTAMTNKVHLPLLTIPPSR